VAAGRRDGVRDVQVKSSATDVVTEFDRAAEQLIVAGILAARPHDSIVGEEGSARSGSSGLSWYVDPIDGTTNFLYGLAEYAVSIGVADAEGMLVGVVRAPALQETFTAVRGGGAWCNRMPIRVNALERVEQALVGTGFSYQAERRAYQASVVGHLLPRVRDVRRLGAASLDLCYVACGRLDAYAEEWLNWWDMAAGELIAREAGAATGDYSGGPAGPEQLLASAPGVMLALRQLLAAGGARRL
jgi:myo-inositol-1(or 4)-monophosphatase